MKRLHTHYDNLCITQQANEAEIRAAYRRLCKRHHPDRTQNPQEAHRIMCIINHSYQILSNPDTRKQHDEWITTQMAQENRISSPMPKNALPKSPMPWRTLFLCFLLMIILLLGLAHYSDSRLRSQTASHPINSTLTTE